MYDVIGVGAGPSNLALLAAIDERAAARPTSAMVFERRRSFGWHSGMLLAGATMQISFLKDLATLRNPLSPYSFVNYLSAHGRLVDFINHQTFFPTRVEFADYLEWVASTVRSPIVYGSEVVEIERLSERERARFRVRVNGPTGPVTKLARTVVVATGLRESLPSWATPGPRLFHNYRLLDNLEQIAIPDDARLLVVGSGQSAAEVVSYLYNRYQGATVESVFNSYGFQPADDSPFANRVFDPQAVDRFYHASDTVRRDLLTRHRTTNYSCVDLDLIKELYAIEYSEAVTGRRRLVIRPATEVVSARTTDGSADGPIDVTVRDRMTGTTTTATYDVVICATGFTSSGLSGLATFPDLEGTVSLTRDYQVRVGQETIAGLFVQGADEPTHGLGATLLSNVAVRAGELLDSIEKLTADTDSSAALLDRVG
ncbi:lysine N(6)-hydroxylase/L-ornithine N(5)-oxygenase family protein [Nocardia sp. NPDC051570]|uniref:lysine N(6)-hydroxylase/L-ornithine N(5)-oxygenase family protein n=1 Tax=Nocardia sp. NPDC051570 TaxID=3364324 RepID=UPI0037A38EBF